MPISTQNGPFSPNETFYRKITNMINTHYNFGSKMAYLPQSHFHFLKNHNLNFMYLLAPFIVLILKKISLDLELQRHTIFKPKMTHLPKINFFFRKTINIIFMFLLLQGTFIMQNSKIIL